MHPELVPLLTAMQSFGSTSNGVFITTHDIGCNELPYTDKFPAFINAGSVLYSIQLDGVQGSETPCLVL
jgi:hypothetical protein